MNFSKAKIGIFFPGLAIAGAMFLNIANAHLLLLIWVIFSLWAARANDSRMYSPVLIMLLLSLWITLAQFWSGVGSIGWFTTWTYLAIPLAYVGWQFHSRSYPTAWPYMQNFLGLLGSLLAVWGIVQVAAFNYTRAVGPLADPNAYGCLLNILWFPLFTRFLSSKNEHAVKLYGIVLFLIQMALMMSGSRTASLIWVLLFAIIALLLWKVVSLYRLVFICAIAVGNYLIYSLHSGHLAVSSYEAAISIPHTIQVAQAANFPRLLMWKSTLHMWLDAPWLGGGLGSWNYIYPAYRNANETGTSGYFAHNDYLQLLQEGGVVLFILIIALLGWFYLSNIRKLGTSHGLDRIEKIGILAGITAVIMHATVNFSFYLIYINILVGIYFGRLSQVSNHPTQKESGTSAGSLNKVIYGMALILVTVNGFHALLSSAGLSLLRTESSGWDIVHAIEPESSPYSVAVLLASIRPSDMNAQRYIAASLEYEVINNQTINLQQARAMFDEIISGYELMRRQNKYDAAIPANEAGFLLNFGRRYGPDLSRLLIARELLQESLRKDPSRVDSAILFAQTYIQVGEIQTANGILAGMIPKAWRTRDQMIIEAEILKLKMPQQTRFLSDIQQELRGMRVNCAVMECGESYSKILKKTRQVLDDLGKEELVR